MSESKSDKDKTSITEGNPLAGFLEKQGEETLWSPAVETSSEKGSSPSQGSPSGHLPTSGGEESQVGIETASKRVLNGRYELLSLLGEGGMGSVYKAHDRELDEFVALKLLHRDMLKDEEAIRRFKQEVKLARRVTHRHVARTFDLGEVDGAYFLTMELIDGESLSSLLRRERVLSLSRVAALGEAICDGLQAAHEESIVHRDLKPDNILIAKDATGAKDSRVALTDFGIARLEAGHNEHKTAMGVVIGTPTYMAPEQFEGKGQLDARTDIYALGCILFEMMAGSPAWLGDNFLALATARFVQPPPDPRDRRPEVSAQAAALVMKCMAREPQARFASAREVAMALRKLTLPETQEDTTKATGVGVDAGVGAGAGTGIGIGMPPLLPTLGQALLSTTSRRLLMPTQPGQRVVAVLPFRNDGAAEDDYLADGLMEDLIDTLSMVEDLKVRSRGMVIPYRGRDEEPVAVGRSLGVETLVTGSLHKVGDALQIRTRLISTIEGNQLWAKKFRTSAAELFEISDEIASQVATALRVKVSQEARRVTHDAEAIDLYLRGRYELRRSWHGDVSEAVQLFDQARARAPSDPLLLSGAAMARARHAFFGDFREQLEVAQLLAEQAVATAPERPETLFALALVRYLERRMADAIRLLEQALSLHSTYADAHDLLGRIHSEVGELSDATRHLRLSLALDPSILSARWDLMRCYTYLGEWDRYDELCLLPVNEPTDIAIRTITMARINLWRPNPQPITLPQLDDERVTNGAAHSQRVFAAGRLLPEDEANWLGFLSKIQAPHLRTLLLQQLAEQRAFGRDVTACLETLAQVVDAGLYDRNWFTHCPAFAILEQEPRYQTLRDIVQARADAMRQT